MWLHGDSCISFCCCFSLQPSPNSAVSQLCWILLQIFLNRITFHSQRFRSTSSSTLINNAVFHLILARLCCVLPLQPSNCLLCSLLCSGIVQQRMSEPGFSMPIWPFGGPYYWINSTLHQEASSGHKESDSAELHDQWHAQSYSALQAFSAETRTAASSCVKSWLLSGFPLST